MNENLIYSKTDKERLDSYLVTVFPGMSRSHITALIRGGSVTVNGKKVKAGYAMAPGDSIEAVFPEEPEKTELAEEDIPLEIVYEDADVIVINKPKGMVVHPAAGHSSGTLVNALMHHCKDSLSGINGELRPGIVHRIDRDTTGLLIACKNDTAHNGIAEQLKVHSITRRYIALVHGNMKEESGTVDRNIVRSRTDRKKMAVTLPGEGRTAVTHYRVLERFGTCTLIECRLETGRTHQIRVHMSSEGHPLCGDEVYGIRKDPFSGNGQYLHAAVLGFIHPVSGEYLEFSAPLPEYFEKTLAALRKENKQQTDRRSHGGQRTVL